MSGPFSSTPVIPAPGAAAAPASINCGPFWPDLDLVALRAGIRIDQVVTEERLRGVASNAVLDIMDELDAWRLEQVAAGFTSLKDVPGRHKVDGRSDYEIRWDKAVLSVVAADLADRQLGQSARASGMDRVEELASDVDVHRQNVTYAVRDFLGRPRVIAEAI